MIWDGTSPLRPEHEVAYRGWPTERVWIRGVRTKTMNGVIDKPYTVLVEHPDGSFTSHKTDGQFAFGRYESLYDLIPLQQKEPGNEPCNPKN